MSSKVSFPVFFILWADLQKWDVPAFHIHVCEFLESFSETALLMMPRGHAKSTILAVYNAWRYYCEPSYRILHQGDQDDTAYKMSRDTLSIIERHPLTRKMKKEQGEVQMWWVTGSNDPRNPSMQARGITSNVTSSRADEIQNDDVEVPRNIQSPDAREKLRYRLSEQTHILVPGGKRLYVGTPHTHHSLYDEVKRGGAECLILRMFEEYHRTNNSDHASLSFKPEFIFTGIGAGAKLLEAGIDYTLTKMNDGLWHVMLQERAEVFDCYSSALWPERFNRSEMARRRKECRTLNEWDSQYMLMARPIGNVRIDPERIPVYDCEPVIENVNNSVRMVLNGAHIVGASLAIDPASGKLKSDVSAMSLIFQDASGVRYWHRAIQLVGDVAEFAEDGKKIVGGQVLQVCDIVEKYRLSRVQIETNGIGKFMPVVLRAAFKQRGIVCGVSDDHSTQNKNKRILEAFEPILLSGMLKMSKQVAGSPAYTEMLEFNPASVNNDDDYIDSAAKAITSTPERIKTHGKALGNVLQNWLPQSGVYDVQVDI